MKILRTTGIVVGIHALVLLVIFINPGCSSTTKGDSTAADSVGASAPAPVAAAPAGAPAAESAPAVGLVPVASTNAFYAPTRPNSAAAGALEPAAPVTDVTPAATYTVKSGDSMWLIAHHNHLKVSELAAANGMKTTATLHAGQKLLIPSKASAPVATEAPAAANAPGMSSAAPAIPAAKGAGETKYTVKSGEALSTIAKRFGLTTGDLAMKNNITDPRKIRPGQELIIPAGHMLKPGKKSRKGTASATTGGAPAASSAESTPAPAPAAAAPEAAPPAADTTPTLSVPIIKIDGADSSAAPSSSAPAK